ncbi:AAA family ATPase [Actinomyces slackii]|uniref:ATP-dependent zinc metalloprotease FtsH n=1 Tax=Actinomyces slackii TaxID=52774 RepID=A0A3S4U1J3_9ACTO|nr:AAA family ATPase [Actinomyces slackii]VEG74189.1 ATP-dependent zinc metalloprotease FtsH [Actinomyces slackii]
MSNPVIDSLQRAVEASPNDVPLRLHLAELLISEGRGSDAVTHCATALHTEPDNARARELMAQALSAEAPAVAAPAQAAPQAPVQGAEDSQGPDAGQDSPAQGPDAGQDSTTQGSDAGQDSTTQGSDAGQDSTTQGSDDGFDWARAEDDLGAGPAAPFIDAPPSPPSAGQSQPPAQPVREPLAASDSESEQLAWEVEDPEIRLADVGGLADVKQRLEVSFLAPLRNPELRRLYGKSLRGGLLLYGPPGVGKTFIARAVAGEMGASFINVALTDILDPYLGNSEANIHSIFTKARESSPCVVFLDELDAIGLKRSYQRHFGIRGVINQLLQELDGIEGSNNGLYVLAATNTPWDLDPALRRPGRLDRAILVLPPDEPARAAIVHTHLKDRPVEGIDLHQVAAATEGFTGADLAHVCETAAEKALMDSVRSGAPRLIGMADLHAAIAEIRPSTGPWFETARNVVQYADHSGEYAELRAWMQARRLL